MIVIVSHLGLGNLIPGGFGVTIFFFLSGYLIISLLRGENESSGTVSLKAFFVRRSVRILPPLYITMIVTMMLAASGLLKTGLNPLSIAVDATFLTNYSGFLGGHAGLPIPLWSLDVEEHFYILFAFTYYFFLRHLKPSHAATVCFSACIFFLALRIVTALAITDLEQIYYWSHTRMDSILAGGCLALWQNPTLDKNTAWRPRAPHVLGALAVLLLCFVVRSPFFRETFRYSLQAGALFVIFSHALADNSLVARMAELRIIRMTALLSYTLYLIHFPVLKILESLHPAPSPAILALGVILLSYLYAALMRWTVEKPLAQWRSARAKVPQLAEASNST
jgi:peptidoglycan/LPS O-acetylase OafA/YrhL